MKNFLISASLLVINSILSQAQTGTTIIYHARFYLHNGRSIQGTVEYNREYGHGLDENNKNRFCSDTGMISLLKIVAKTDCRSEPVENKHIITIIRKRDYLTPHPLRDSLTGFGPSLYYFCTPEDILAIALEDICRVEFVNAEYNYNWAAPFVVGPAGMIDTVRTRRFWNELHLTELPYASNAALPVIAEVDGYHYYNYNSGINRAVLVRLAGLKSKEL